LRKYPPGQPDRPSSINGEETTMKRVFAMTTALAFAGTVALMQGVIKFRKVAVKPL